MYYILEINGVLFNIYNNSNSALVHLFKLSQHVNKCCVKEFNDGSINGVYKVKNKKIVYTTQINEKIVVNEINNLPLELVCNFSDTNEVEPSNINHKTCPNQAVGVMSSDINVNLPINSEIKISEESEEVDMDELKRKIDELNQLKEAELNNLENLNQNLHEYENEVIKEKFSVDNEKNKLKADKGKWEEFKNIFNVDKKIYRIMKEQLEKNEIDYIPELFEKKYPIFSVLDDNNLLDIPNDIYEYIKLLPQDDTIYIPKNIALKGLFNNDISSISLTELKDSTKNYETTIETDED